MTFPHAYCITLKETPERTKRLTNHLDEQSINFSLFEGVNSVALGLTTVNLFHMDVPEGIVIEQRRVGNALSHILLWRHLNDFAKNLTDEARGDWSAMVLEDDAVFVEGWRRSLEIAIKSLPEDWDMLLIGSCNTFDKTKEAVGDKLCKCLEAQCTHAYIVRASGLQILLKTQTSIWAHIDIALVRDSYPHMKIFTVLPRLVEQTEPLNP